MFAAVLRRELANVNKDATVESAGYLSQAAEGLPAANEWAVIKDESGIDLSEHRSRRIDGVGKLSRFDLVICMSPTAVNAISKLGIEPDRILLVNAEGGGIPDPGGRGQGAHNECYRAIVRLVNDLIGSGLK